MKCPNCKYQKTEVVDSRSFNDGESIKRRRQCNECNHKFITYESYDENTNVISRKKGPKEDIYQQLKNKYHDADMHFPED